MYGLVNMAVEQLVKEKYGEEIRIKIASKA
jgi:hypothetical protein